MHSFYMKLFNYFKILQKRIKESRTVLTIVLSIVKNVDISATCMSYKTQLRVSMEIGKSTVDILATSKSNAMDTN
jgi:hypothetical protein